MVGNLVPVAELGLAKLALVVLELMPFEFIVRYFHCAFGALDLKFVKLTEQYGAGRYKAVHVIALRIWASFVRNVLVAVSQAFSTIVLVAVGTLHGCPK